MVVNPDKDQSYFLYGLRQDQLAHTRFPLGELTKPEVRDVARRHGLVTAEKPESQEICFVPGGDYRDALRDRAGWKGIAGPLLDSSGDKVGEHRGAAAYTVGQRQGLGVALGAPRYVSSIDAAANIVTLGRRDELQRREFAVDDVSFVHGEPPEEPFAALVRIRHRAESRARHRATAGRGWGITGGDSPFLVGGAGTAGLGTRAGAGGRLLRREGPRPGAGRRKDRDRGLAPDGGHAPARTPARGRGRRHRPRLMEMQLPDIGTAPVLAVIVGAFHTALYVLLRGSVGARLPFVFVAAVLGAFAGQALGLRLGDPLRVGDFGLISSSVLAWLEIVVVVAAGILGPSRRRT